MSNKLYTILDIINKSTKFLKNKGVENPKLDTEKIISHVIKTPRINLYLNFEKILSEENCDKIKSLIIKRGRRIPLQHILETIEFYDCKIKTDNRALVPRPETERLVELVAKYYNKDFSGKFLDLGTGSGAIIISLCKLFKNVKGEGLDNSELAIELAKENIRLNSLKNASVKIYDWNKNELNNNYDLIISNPPYLTDDEWLTASPEVNKNDPKEALISGNEGINDLLRIIKIATPKLNNNGILALETGINHKEHLLKIMPKEYQNIKTIKDYNGFDRYIIAHKT